MDIAISLPLDDDGYIRRECPSCQDEFKWHQGPVPTRPEDAIDPPVYHCPLCSAVAELNQWFTQDQVQYQEQMVQFHLTDIVGDELQREFRGSSSMKFEKARNTAPAPEEIFEPNDMIIVEAPCHPWEPVKVPEERADAGPLHCLVCGEQYTA